MTASEPSSGAPSLAALLEALDRALVGKPAEAASTARQQRHVTQDLVVFAEGTALYYLSDGGAPLWRTERSMSQ